MVWIRLGAWAMFAGVLLGAFAAHGLRGRLSPEAWHTYQTGVLYHLIHGVGLLAVGCLGLVKPGVPMVAFAGRAFLIGIVLFSGSLYLLSLTGVKRLGMITPLGGLAFLVGWACLALAAR